MDYVWYLFRFEGRINRANFWLAVPIILCLMMVLGILAIIVSKLFGGPGSISFRIGDIFGALDPESYRSLSTASLGQAVIKAIGTPLFLWIYLAIAIKRLHDRNKSAWWLLLFFALPGLYSQFGGRLGDWLGDWATMLFSQTTSPSWPVSRTRVLMPFSDRPLRVFSRISPRSA